MNDNRQTADETVAELITRRLVQRGLLPETYGEQTRRDLARGRLKAEDWRLLAEKALELEMREGNHGRQTTD